MKRALGRQVLDDHQTGPLYSRRFESVNGGKAPSSVTQGLATLSVQTTTLSYALADTSGEAVSSKQSTTWLAEPHTIAKIGMLRSYLYQWFSILGRRFNGKDLWYIDGFAGPGEYENYPQGSPLAALASAESALNDSGEKWMAGTIHCVFMEEVAARAKHLKRKLDEMPVHPRIRRHVYHGSFVEGFAWLNDQADNPFRSSDPLFAFIDPFGPSGMSFAVVKDLLSRRASEVLVNLDSDGVSRIYSAGENAGHKEVLTDVFGDNSWEFELTPVRCDTESSSSLPVLERSSISRTSTLLAGDSNAREANQATGSRSPCIRDTA
jgi:three-Cys-motif partner protein